MRLHTSISRNDLPKARLAATPGRGWLTLLALALVLGAAPEAHAQYSEGGARTLALGRAGTALSGEAWGHANPAAWSALESNVAALQASQAYGLSELRLAAGTVAAPTRFGTAALSARTYGFSEHRETRVQVGLARKIPLSATRWFEAGVSVGYESSSTEGFESVGSLLLNAGVQGQLVRNLRGGMSARNLQSVARVAEDELRGSAATVPAIAVGVAYTPTDKATLVLDAEQDRDYGLSVRGGIEAKPVDVLALRAGVSTNPVRLSFGAGFQSGILRADLAVERHESLGMTPSFGISVSF